METEHIKEFLVMAEKLNYTAAGNELFISQSSLFKHVRAMEEELGFSLFEKSGKKVVMTDYGKMFVHHAKKILNEIEEYRTEVENFKEAQANILGIVDGYPNSEMYFAFKKAYPQYMLNPMVVSPADEIIDCDMEVLVLKGNLPDFEEQFDYVELTTDSVAAIVPNDHPQAKRSSIKVTELKNEEIIGISHTNVYVATNRREPLYDAESVCREAGFEPNIVMTAFPGSEAAKLVSQGGGISLLFKNAILRRLGSNVSYVDLDPKIVFPVRAYYRKGRELSKAGQAFISFAKSWYESYKPEE